MGRLKIGVIIDSFRLGVKNGIRKAAELGVEGFQIWTTDGEMAPWNLSRTGRRDFLHFVKSQGLVVSALCGHLPRANFTHEEGLDERIDKTKQILELSRDLHVPVVTTHIGVIAEDENAPGNKVLREALSEVGNRAEKLGVVLAAETGPESPQTMAAFIKALPTEGIRVNYDPANLYMRGFDPVAGVRELADLIVHTHAKDGAITPDGKRQEMPLGQGGVQWPEYLAAMAEIGYDGFFTIERESGDEPVKDVTDAVAFLRRF